MKILSIKNTLKNFYKENPEDINEIKLYRKDSTASMRHTTTNQEILYFSAIQGAM